MKTTHIKTLVKVFSITLLLAPYMALATTTTADSIPAPENQVAITHPHPTHVAQVHDAHHTAHGTNHVHLTPEQNLNRVLEALLDLKKEPATRRSEWVKRIVTALEKDAKLQTFCKILQTLDKENADVKRWIAAIKAAQPNMPQSTQAKLKAMNMFFLLQALNKRINHN